METREIHGRDADPALIGKIDEALVEDKPPQRGRLRNIHDVRVRHTAGGYFVNFPLLDRRRNYRSTRLTTKSTRWSARCAPIFPTVMRIVGHAEPAPRRA